MTANASGTMQARQFTPGQLTPEQLTPGQFTPGRFNPGYTLPFTIDIVIKKHGVNCPWVGEFTPGIVM